MCSSVVIFFPCCYSNPSCPSNLMMDFDGPMRIHGFEDDKVIATGHCGTFDYSMILVIKCTEFDYAYRFTTRYLEFT